MNTPKGKLIPIGGSEAKKQEHREDGQKVDFENGILKEVIDEMKGKSPAIMLLALASKDQDKMFKTYRDAFGKLGHDIDIIAARSTLEVDSTDNLRKLNSCNGIFITGGDQVRLKELLAKSRFLKIMKERYQNDFFTIAGTSAGAMILPEEMMESGGNEQSLVKGLVSLTPGFKLISNIIIDTHFMNRGRFSRLTEALMANQTKTGAGIGEDTAIVITNGNKLKAIGSGTITIIKTDKIEFTNYPSAKAHEPLYIKNLKVHIMASGVYYYLNSGRMGLIKN